MIVFFIFPCLTPLLNANIIHASLVSVILRKAGELFIGKGVEFLFGKGLQILRDYIGRTRYEVGIQRASALRIPDTHIKERIEVIKECDKADKILEKLEKYISDHQNEHEKILNRLAEVYNNEILPLANRMDEAETRLDNLYWWKEQQEKRQQEWDLWRSDLDSRVTQLERESIRTRTEVEDQKQHLTALENRLKPHLIVNIYYQWLDIFSSFWKNQFDNTAIADRNRFEYEGVGGDIGICLASSFKFGAGAHLMVETEIKRESGNEFTGTPEIFTLTMSGIGYQIYGLAIIPLAKTLSFQGGGGYYWLDYNIHHKTEMKSTSQIWKNEGAFALGVLSLEFSNFTIYGEGNLAVKSRRSFAFLNKRIGISFKL